MIFYCDDDDDDVYFAERIFSPTIGVLRLLFLSRFPCIMALDDDTHTVYGFDEAKDERSKVYSKKTT